MGNILSSLLHKTIASYAFIAAVVGVIAYGYLADKKKKTQKQNARPRGRDANQPKKENRAKRQRVETFANQVKAHPKTDAAASEATVAEVITVPAPSKSKDEIDDRAFAQRMAKNKQNKFLGNLGKATSDQKHKQKSVKQSKVKAAEASEPVQDSAPSSVVDVDVDAEDDQSPITSPSVSAADATGVSDMLEQPTSGPSVLRLTNTEEKAKKARKPKAPEPAETKKQRQNRQKREQEKALRAEQEKERKVLEEAQRRTARLAEGRAAADGAALVAAQKANAWAEKSANSVAPKNTPAAHAPLDTLDHTAAPIVNGGPAVPAKINGHENKESILQNARTTDWTEVPYSEEQQIKMIADEEEWKPVETKKAKKAKKNNAGVASSDEGSVYGYAPPAATTTLAPQSKAALANGRFKPQTMSTQSSFAALAVDGADLEDEEEQEWDV